MPLKIINGHLIYEIESTVYTAKILKNRKV